MPEELKEPPLLKAVSHLWEWFQLLNLARTGNGFNANALSYTEIKAWSDLTENKLAAWEVTAIKLLDNIYINSLGK